MENLENHFYDIFKVGDKKKILEFLLKNVDKFNILHFYRNEGNIFHIVSRLGYFNILNIIVDKYNKKQIIKAINSTFRSMTPLHLACNYGFYSICKKLINLDCNINALTDEGNTPINLAIINGHKEIIELLIDSNANLNIKNDNGKTSYVLIFKYMKHLTTLH